MPGKEHLMDDNPYKPPALDDLPSLSPDGAGTPSTLPTLSADEIQAFVGKNAPYYLRKWAYALETGRPVRRFNAAAFWLSGLWIPYRKMYRVLLIMFGVLAVQIVGEAAAVYFGLLSFDERAMGLWDRLVGLAISIAIGTRGNDWYLSHTRRTVARIRALGLPEAEYHAELTRQGGKSLLAALCLFVCFLAALFTVAFVTGLFFNLE
jgi:hypothetical protein